MAETLDIDGMHFEMDIFGAGSIGWKAAARAHDERGRKVLVASAVGLTKASAVENLIALLRFRGLAGRGPLHS